jgi:hypothetical protein
MFYRAAIIKNDRNARSVTLREMTKEQVEEMLPRIKSFLFPDEDSSGYRHWIWENKIDSYVSGIKIPEFTVNVYRPVEKKKVEGFEDFEDDDWDVMEDGSGWYEEIVEADSLEEAREKVLSKECPYKNVGYEECSIYINEVSDTMLKEEAINSVLQRIENYYIEAMKPEITVREWRDIHVEMENSDRLKYLAYRYMRSVFAHVSLLERETDLAKMSAQEFVDIITTLPLRIEDYEEWNKKFQDFKAKYGKEEDVD